VKQAMLFRRTLRGFEPVNDIAREAMGKVKIGADVRLEIKRPRSLAWHKRYFALVNLIADNSSYTPDDVHMLLKMRAGCRRLIKERSGREIWVPDSVAFDKMDRDEWQVYWSRVVDYVSTELLPGVTAEELEREIRDIAGIAPAA
jgi:hypothetical protein